MRIGELELELTKPEGLDEQLVQLTGCTAAEIHARLPHAAIADHVGAALLPFVKDPPARQVLAQAIAAEGVVHVRRQVAKLYADELGIPPDEMPEHLRGIVDTDGNALPPPPEPKKKARARG